MTRRTKDYTADQGRDAGKMFRITEMSAAQGEKWAIRAFGAIARSGTHVPPEIQDQGMAGLVFVSVRALLAAQFEEAEPLLDEVMGQIEIVPEPRKPAIARPILDDDVEEMLTITLLRKEWFELQTGFSVADLIQKLKRLVSAQQEPMPDMSTSPAPSEQ